MNALLVAVANILSEVFTCPSGVMREDVRDAWFTSVCVGILDACMFAKHVL